MDAGQPSLHHSTEMAHYMSRTPSPAPSTGSLASETGPDRVESLLTDFIKVAERQRENSPAGPLYIPLPHESEESEAEMEARPARGQDTPTRDERDLPEAEALPGKRTPSPGTVVHTEERGRRLVLASTIPTYTPPPVGGLHSGLRMVVADLTQTFSPPPDRACGDQWRGPDYVPTPVAELERLEVRKRELELEIRDREAGYSINWTNGQQSLGPSPPAIGEGGPPSPREEIRRPMPSAFSAQRGGGDTSGEAPPAYTERADTEVTHTPVRRAQVVTSDDHLRSRRESQPARDLGTRGVTEGQMLPPAVPAAGSARETTTITTQVAQGSFLEQFIPAEKAPLDAEGEELASSTARLINRLWSHPMTRAETTEVYNTLPRPANVEGLQKTRLNPEIETTLPARVRDNDTALAAAQWGVQFAARPIATALDGIETGRPLDQRELVTALVTTLKILARTSNTLLGMRRDNVRPSLQAQLKPLAKKDGNQGFKYVLGEDLTAQVTSIEASRKTASSIMRGLGSRMHTQRNYDRKQGNYRGGQGKGRPNQNAPRHRQEETKFHPHRPSGGNQNRPYRGGRGRGTGSYRGRPGDRRT